MKWIDVPGWESRYQVSEHGFVRSKDMVVNAKGSKTAVRRGRMLTLVRKNNGYLCVTLTNGVDRPQIAIHRLVARAFIGECPIGLHVLHGDGNKSNNHHLNLRYGTPADNHDDTLSHGNRLMGDTHPLSKLKENDVRYIRESELLGTELALKFNVSSAHISAIRRNRAWKHI